MTISSIQRKGILKHIMLIQKDITLTELSKGTLIMKLFCVLERGWKTYYLLGHWCSIVHKSAKLTRDDEKVVG